MLLRLLTTELDKIEIAPPAAVEMPAAAEAEPAAEPDVVPMQNPAA